MSFEVYALTLEDGAVRYVGLTEIGAQNRLERHRRSARGGQRQPVYDWMRHHGPENVRAVVLCTAATSEDLRLAEIWCIATLREDGHALLNATDGGDGWAAGSQHSAETRAKIAESRRGMQFTDEHRANIAASQEGRWTEEARQHQRDMATGRARTEVTKRKLSDAFVGRSKSPETVARMVEAQRQRRLREQKAKETQVDSSPR